MKPCLLPRDASVHIASLISQSARWMATKASAPSRSHIGKIKPIMNPSRPDHHLSFPAEVVAHSGLPCTDKPYLVLGIETSCDDTGVAVVSSTGKIYSNVVISQVSCNLYMLYVLYIRLDILHSEKYMRNMGV